MTDVEVLPSSPALTRRWRWPWLVAVLAVIFFGAGIPTAVWFVHWRSSLHEMTDYPDYGVGVHYAVGQSSYFGVEAEPAVVVSDHYNGSSTSVDIHSVRPVITGNTAHADITVLHCVLAYTGGMPLGWGTADVRSSCAKVSPFKSGNLKLGPKKGDDDIVIAVTPRRAGTVRISGVQLTYSSGLRHGAQHTGAQISVSTAKPETTTG